MASSAALLDSSNSDEGFCRSRRLLNPASFKPVFSKTQFRVSCPEFLILAIAHQQSRTNTLTPTTSARLGMVIAKKHVKHAVDRNRTKRIIRERFRLTRQHLPALDIVVLARANAGKLSKTECAMKIDTLFGSLAQKAETARKASRVA